MLASIISKAESLRKTLDLASERRVAGRTGKILRGYIGGIGDENLGDEAMLEAANRLLPESTLVPIGFPRQERRLAKMGLSGSRFYRSVILGGGTLINEYVWSEQVRTALEQGVPVWSLGTGVGSCGFGHPAQANLVRFNKTESGSAAEGGAEPSTEVSSMMDSGGGTSK